MFNSVRVSKLVSVAAAAALGVLLLTTVSSPVKAETMAGNEATVTFDRPVEVPGKVLPPGTYVFKTTDSDEIVQVFSSNQKQLFATLSVIPQDRPAQDTRFDSFVQLNKTHTGAPQEVEGFFVAGRDTGFQFVYPTSQARR
jgi:hypothetical protein